MVGGEHYGEAHGAATHLVEHRRRLGAIDDGALPGLPVDEQIGVVVAQLRDRDDLHALGQSSAVMVRGGASGTSAGAVDVAAMPLVRCSTRKRRSRRPAVSTARASCSLDRSLMRPSSRVSRSRNPAASPARATWSLLASTT